MTTRTPDFYRVVRIMNGHREYLNSAHDWTRHASSAWSYESKHQAASASDPRPGTRIVPVYVKVTRKPKRYHGIAWAAKQDQLGMAVVCDDVVGAPTYQSAIRTMMRSKRWRLATEGETYGVI